ncbi:DUF3093 family protein [Corynebacterium poyangense]|uniref:DUF3093 family protein n=1 Tax=Corynebacterium poyangense TaxID=2684405 RepID=A0A7H0SSC2_9CORY|nr:DUF3093 domain-containing protein [Corynebacterium poyangense]QNQ91447.1 DUF3093 family protein [Corynebacterium poyangense]
MEKAETLYEERQWIPWYWWIFAALVVALISAQLGHNRSLAWYIVPATLLGALILWWFLSISSTRIRVFQDHQGGRWLQAGKAILPASVVSRSLAVPASAKRNAMGRQLDPAAFVVSHGWVKEMVMLVLDDPEDPTPYWLVGTKNPRAVLEHFLPDQADEAIKHFPQ